MDGNCAEPGINLFDIRRKRRNKPVLSHSFAENSSGAAGGERESPQLDKKPAYCHGTLTVCMAWFLWEKDQ